MPIVLQPADRDRAVEALKAYLLDELDLEVGSVAADALLEFVATDLMPLAYNQAIADVQARLSTRVDELAVDLFEAPFVQSRR
jgi:uncharacterized protein (DUF2164 family)